jgi:putative transposase
MFASRPLVLSAKLNNITKKWTKPISDWRVAMGRFTILFKDSMPKP